MNQNQHSIFYHSKLVVGLFKARGVGLDCSTVTVLRSGSPSEFLLKNAISRLLAPYLFARLRLRDYSLAVKTVVPLSKALYLKDLAFMALF